MAVNKRRGMTDDEIASLFDNCVNDADAHRDTDRSENQKLSIDYYEGRLPDIQPEDGRSSVVSHDVADAVNPLVAALVTLFLKGDHIWVYEPKAPAYPDPPGPGDVPPGIPPQVIQQYLMQQWQMDCQQAEEFANQATDYINHKVLDECNGYMKIRLGIHDGAQHGNGIVKFWWDKSPDYRVQKYKGLTKDEFNRLVGADDVELISKPVQYPDPDNPPAPIAPNSDQMMVEVPNLYDCEIKRKIPKGVLKLGNVPLEDFLISSTAVELTEEGTPFCGDRQLRPKSDLIADGYDRDKVMDLPAVVHASTEGQSQKDARDPGGLNGATDATDRSMEKVEVIEGYLRCDKNGDGIAEWRRIVRAGGGGKMHTLLDEEWGDDLPYADVGRMFPVPHRWRGRSVFDETVDIQRIRSVGSRIMLDSFYQATNPQRAAQLKNVINVDALESPRFGEVVDVKGDPRAVIADITPAFVGDKAFAILDHFDNVAERRVGIGTQSMGLDPEALSNQTARAAQMKQATKEARVEDYGRNIANDGMKRLGRCLLRLIVKNQDRADIIRLRGKFVQMDPRQWSDAMSVTVHTGLGAGSQDRDISAMNAVAMKQENVVKVLGPVNDYCNIGHLFETYRKLATAAGLKNTESYFPVITQDMIAQMKQQQAAQGQKPDPKLMVEMQKLQIEQAKAQSKIQTDNAKAQADAQRKDAQMAHDQEMAKYKMMLDLSEKRQDNAMKAALQKQMNDAKLAFERELGAQKLDIKHDEMLLEAQLTDRANQMEIAMGATQNVHRVPDTNIIGAQ